MADAGYPGGGGRLAAEPRHLRLRSPEPADAAVVFAAVAAKAGTEREGVLRSRLLVHGKFHDAVVFSLVRPRAPA